MGVCPGCGRCRECGQRAAPAPIYPWYGQHPYVQPGQPIWIEPSQTVPPYTFTWTIGANTGIEQL